MKIAAFIALAGAMCAAPALADTTVIHAGALVIDAESQPRGPSTITVTDGKIVSVADGFTAAPAQAVTVDLKDKTVVPGMVDLHVHLTGDPGGDFWKGAVEPDEWDVVVGAKNARLTALAGFTTVREAGSGPASAFSLRRGTAEGFIDGPRIVAAGPSLAASAPKSTNCSTAGSPAPGRSNAPKKSGSRARTAPISSRLPPRAACSASKGAGSKRISPAPR